MKSVWYCCVLDRADPNATLRLKQVLLGKKGLRERWIPGCLVQPGGRRGGSRGERAGRRAQLTRRWTEVSEPGKGRQRDRVNHRGNRIDLVGFSGA